MIHLCFYILCFMVSATFHPSISLRSESNTDNEFERILTGSIQSVSWNLEGTQIAYTSLDTGSGSTLGIVDIESGDTYPLELPESDEVNALLWSPNGNWIAAATDQLYVIEAGTRITRFAYSPPIQYGVISNLRWSSSSLKLSLYTLNEVGEAFIIILGVETGETEIAFRAIPDDSYALTPNLIESGFDWSPNERLFAVPNPKSLAIGVWDQSGALLSGLDIDLRERLNNPTHSCSSIAFEREGLSNIRWDTTSHILALGSWSGGLELCQFSDDGTVIYRSLDERATYALAWSPDGNWLTSGEFLMDPSSPSCEVRFFNAEDDYQRSVYILESDPCSIFDLDWSLDSQRLALAASNGLWIN
jgi:WD40 repeat protein